MREPVMLTAIPLLALVLLGNPDSTAASRADVPSDSLPAGFTEWGRASRVNVPIFSTFDRPRKIIGRVQRGDRLPVRPAKTERTCYDNKKKGKWLATPGGFLCTTSGITTGAAARKRPSFSRADGTRPVPFDYVKATPTASKRYHQPKVDANDVAEVQTKAYFLAVDRRLEANGRKWIRTVYGDFVLAKETRPVVPTKLRGTELGGGAQTLPIAFVTGADNVPVRCLKNDRWVKCRKADKFERFAPERRVKFKDELYVLSEDGQLYPEEFVRVARKVPRPKAIGDDDRWVHIDLDEQLFVAYEGDEPRYTSLVSTGVEGHSTPTGVYRVQRKYLTKTMKGPDDTHGRYRVEEIPWVMYYDGNFAVHGAYWHDNFGNVRSHGCTNVAPLDAMWLYNFDQTAMRPGWHANLRAKGGLHVYVTKAEDPTS